MYSHCLVLWPLFCFPAAARFESGTYYSIDEASRALVEKLEHYATDISLNGHTLSDSGNEDSNCKN